MKCDSTVLCRTLCTLLAIVCLAPAGASAQQTAGPAELIRRAVERGDKRVVIPAGTYRVPPGIVVANAKDLEIVADGVTLVFTRLSRGIAFERCMNVTVRGLTIDYDPLPFTQGKVIAVADGGGAVDVKLDAGYPRVAYSRIDVCDPKTRTRKRGMPFLWGTQAKLIGDDVVRVSRLGIGKAASVGDPVSLSGGPVGGPPHGVTIEHCDGMVLHDLTLHTAPGMGILEADGERGTHYLNVRVVPGPRPAGATEDRLLTTTWDALQCKSTRIGPTLEDCEIRDAGDDSWSVQSSDYVVLDARGREAVIGFRDEFCDGPQPRDRLRAADGTDAIIIERHAVDRNKPELPPEIAEKIKSAGAWDYWHVGRKMVRVTFDREPPFGVGQSVYCPDRQCNDFVVRRCKFRSPGRGALVKASRGVIEFNDFTDCHSAVTVNAEVPEQSASGIGQLVIRNNRISGTGYFCPSWESTQAGAVSVVGRPCTIREVTIENNHFHDINGVSICLLAVDGVQVSDNRFTGLHATQPQNTGGKIGIDQHCVIFAAKCTDVRLNRNTADRAGPFTNSLVAGDWFKDHAEWRDGLKVSE